MKVIIIDDEKSARNLIEIMVLDLFPEIEEIYKVEDLEMGANAIKKYQPDIVFLDIEMPKYSGLQILDFFKTDEVNFQIIFITAYNQYAIEAFKLSAVDYLMKPVDVKSLKEAVEKAIIRANKNNVYKKLEDLKSSFHQLSLNTLALEVPNGVIFISYNDIICFEADGMYTKVFAKDKNNYELISKPLKYFSDQLADNDFFYKCHRSYLINLKHIKQFFKQDGGYVLMSNQMNIPIAKNKRDEFMACINKMF